MCKKKWIGFVLATVFAASLSACAAEQKDSSAPPSSAGQPQAAESVPALEGGPSRPCMRLTNERMKRNRCCR